ncbi:CWF19-like protein 2, partial [Ophiophagus hannah]
MEGGEDLRKIEEDLRIMEGGQDLRNMEGGEDLRIMEEDLRIMEGGEDWRIMERGENLRNDHGRRRRSEDHGRRKREAKISRRGRSQGLSLPLPTHCLVLEELGQLLAGLCLVGVALPVVGHIVDVGQDALEELLRAPHQVLIRDEGPADGRGTVSLPTRNVTRSRWCPVKLDGQLGVVFLAPHRALPVSLLCPGPVELQRCFLATTPSRTVLKEMGGRKEDTGEGWKEREEGRKRGGREGGKEKGREGGRVEKRKERKEREGGRMRGGGQEEKERGRREGIGGRR